MPHMPTRVGRACRAAVLVCGVVTAVAPAAAMASTYTVDDDKQDCPNAAFTSIQAAVDQAAPHDTIRVCAGLYQESSTPTGTSNMANPLQAGARNGLTINESLNIVGAGASKVIIQPAPALGTSLADTSPYLRDDGGNVVTIGRQSLGSTDFSEAPVNISGVTIQSPVAYVEAGVAFFNASGSITNSVVGPLAAGAPATQPYGYGVIATDSLLGAGLGAPRRQVTISNSLITGYQAGGVFFDASSGADGSAANSQRSGIIQYGYVDHTRVQGAGAAATVPQTGITYRAGERGTVTNSEIVNNRWAADPTKSSGILLADAETGADPNLTSQPGFSASANAFSGNGYGVFNADITGTAVRTGAPAQAGGNSWDCSLSPTVGVTGPCQGISGGDSVRTAPTTSVPAPLTMPTGARDSAPTVAIRDPLNGTMVGAGIEIDPVVVARDDYGIKSVTLVADGVPVATLTHAPYEFAYTPPTGDTDRTVFLTAIATDSAGQTASTGVSIGVPGPVAAGDGAASTAPSVDAPAPAAPTPTPPVTKTPVAVAPKIVFPKALTGRTQLKVVTITCSDPKTTHCTVTIAGTLKVGKKTVAVKLTGTVTGHKPKTFVLKLSSKTQKLLKGHKGTLRLTTTVTSSGGKKTKSAASIAVKGA